MRAMQRDIVKLMGYIGTACFLAMPYSLQWSEGLFLILAVSGNALLLPQVYGAKQWNLVALNVVGGTGYIINLIQSLCQ